MLRIGLAATPRSARAVRSGRTVRTIRTVRIIGVVAIVLAFGLTTMLAGCRSDDPTVPEFSLYEAPTSPEAVLRNLRIACEERDLAGYEQLFDTDAFEFRFAPWDIDGQDALPPFWTWEFEKTSVEVLFESEAIVDIDVEFTFTDAEDPDPNQISDPPEDSKLVFLTSLTLVVVRDNPDIGEQDIFIVDGDRHEFFFREYPGELADGVPTWKIVQWRDKSLGPGSRLAIHDTSWGRVKWIFNPVSQGEAIFEPSTSPEAVLRNLQAAYEWRLLEPYAELFDADVFAFKFAQVDVEDEDDPAPPSWSWSSERSSTRSMFWSRVVDGVDLDFTMSAPEDPDPNVIDEIPPDSKLVYLTSLTLVVTEDMPGPGDGQNLFIVDGDRHEFFLREYPEELADGKPTWRIVEWRDQSLGTGNLSRVFEMTWGDLKRRYP